MIKEIEHYTIDGNYSYSYGQYSKEVYDQYNLSYPKRTKHTHPYTYDSFIIWTNKEKVIGGAYTDRMQQWDYAKFELCYKKYYIKGQIFWSQENIINIQKFLIDYFDKPNLNLCLLVECCNMASGYPLWYLAWNYNKD